MDKSSSKREYGCPVEAAIDIIGGKWKPVILWHIKDKPMRFTEIRSNLPSVTQGVVITSYSIHYTKVYEVCCFSYTTRYFMMLTIFSSIRNNFV